MKPEPEEEKQKNSSARNLTIFGITAIVLALISSGISLFVYNFTGDIYLDRSRPGFISEIEDDDNNADKNEEVAFPADGIITDEDLTDYLFQLDARVQEITSDSDAFSADALSDEGLNITGSIEE